MKEIVENLSKNAKTIATMESCTGGYIVNAITNIPGASEVLKFSAVTYSNEYKIKMGVNKSIINEYSVYSIEVADEMSKKISEFANSDYGIGITGKLLRKDEHNEIGDDDLVFISIYDRKRNDYIRSSLRVIFATREQNKELILKEVIKMLRDMLNIDKKIAFI